MGPLLLLPAVFSCLLLSAHFLRFGMYGDVGLCLSAPLVLLMRKKWVGVVFPLLLVLGAGLWVKTALALGAERLALGRPWLTMAIIMGAVAAFSLGSALLFRTRRLRERFGAGDEPAAAGAAAFALAAVLLTIVQLKMKPVGILLERFVPGGGWMEGFWLAVYAAWLADKVSAPRESLKWRPRVWSLFSAVFFLELLVGLLGADRFLMTGKLHLPVPTLIVADPVYRSGHLFMLILFGATVLIAGPAWCSWLCYIGAWDDRASRFAAKAGELPGWRKYLRWATLALALGAALVMRLLGAPGMTAMWLAAAFGLIGVGVMVFWSRRSGVMAHCTAYCPIGVLSTRLGRINPFRVRINEGCNECGACARACRYDALHEDDIRRRSPGESCTLCGDCVGKCRGLNIDYRFPGLAPETARKAFMVIVAALHAVFLGVARI